MGAFEYIALDADGREKKGVLEGDTAKQVRQLLRERLEAMNPGLPAAAYDDALRRLTATVASRTRDQGGLDCQRLCHRVSKGHQD